MQNKIFGRSGGKYFTGADFSAPVFLESTRRCTFLRGESI